jgi:hypothetical protein
VVHITVLELLDGLCRYQYGLKTTKGWALAEGKANATLSPR